jgi:hypothetical protein
MAEEGASGALRRISARAKSSDGRVEMLRLFKLGAVDRHRAQVLGSAGEQIAVEEKVARVPTSMLPSSTARREACGS